MAGTDKHGRGSRIRFWVGTVNNPKENGLLSRLEKEPTLPENVRYIAFQLEKGKEGTPHYQVYLELKRGQYLSWVKKHIAEGHWELRRGTGEEASLYCTKDDTRVRGPWVIGKMSMGEKSRTDLIDFRDAIKEGKRKRDLWETHPMQMARYRHMYTDYRSCYMPIRNKEIIVCLLVGSTGTGKTRTVHDTWKDEGYWSMPIGTSSGQWFDGYDKHERVLLDDFAGRMSKMPLTLLLWIVDRYPRYLQVKGSHIWWLPNFIAITSNYHPRKWYDWKDREESYNALCRRIHQVVEFSMDDEGISHRVDHDPPKEYFARRFETLRSVNDVLNKDYKHKKCSNCNKCINC